MPIYERHSTQVLWIVTIDEEPNMSRIILLFLALV